MTKRLFTLCLMLTAATVSALAEDYGIYVAGVEVTSNNASNIHDSRIKAYSNSVNNGKASVVYNKNTKTLTLWNVKIETTGTGELNRCIYNEKCDGLTVVLKGENSFSADNASPFMFEKSTTITSEKDDNNKMKTTLVGGYHAVSVIGSSTKLTISGANLVIESERSCFESDTSFPSMEIIGSTITVTNKSEKYDDGYSIKDFQSLTVSNSNVTLSAKTLVVNNLRNLVLGEGQKDIVTQGTGNGYGTYKIDGGHVIFRAYKSSFTSGEFIDNPKKVQLKMSTKITTTNFPDEKFRAIISGSEIDKDEDGYLNIVERLTLTELDVSNKQISDLKGIGLFTRLTTLKCYSNSLTTLDLSNNTKLQELWCQYNSLTSLNVSGCTSLERLFCNHNSLSELDISKNTGLRNLQCNDNSLTSLDIYGCNKLNYLICAGNQIQGENMGALVANLPQVTAGTLQAYYDDGYPESNAITADQVKEALSKNWEVMKWKDHDWVDYLFVPVDETNFPDEKFRNIVALYDNTNEVKDGLLSEEELKAVTVLVLSESGIENLKGIEHFLWLEELYCPNNYLQSLDVSNNKALKTLNCSYNYLRSLDVSNNKALKNLYCQGNLISGDNMTNLINSLHDAVESDDCWFNVCDIFAENDNVITPEDVTSAENKGWKLRVYNGEYWTFYVRIEINKTNFPDDNFRNFLRLQDFGSDDVLTQKELMTVTSLDVQDMGIKDLTGIEHFLKLTYLNCAWNGLKTLNVLNNTALTNLICYGNALETLNLLSNTNLNSLYCSFNNLSSLDLSKNTKLTTVLCEDLNLTSLDLSKNTNLIHLSCHTNNIKGEQMDALIASLPEVTDGQLDVYFKYYSEHNVCTAQQVAAANAKGWTVYSYDTEGNREVYAGYNPSVPITQDFFPDQNFRNFLLSQDFGSDAFLSEEEINAITELRPISRSIKNMTGIEHFTALKILWCSSNGAMTTFDVSYNKELEELYCDNNGLTSLDVSQNTKLKKLWCFSNKLTTLNVWENTELEELYCSWNGTEEQGLTIYLYNNKKLKSLSCEKAGLTSLDVSQNTELEYLSCYGNSLTSLNVQFNTKLAELNCSGNKLTSLYVLNTSALKTLNCSGNQIQGDDMNYLVNYLPEVTGGVFKVNNYECTQDNVITAAQLATAIGKGWTVQAWDGSKWMAYVEINETNFPDENFRTFLLAQTYGADGYLSPEELLSVTELFVGDKNIADLTGIKFFTALKTLYCIGNTALTTLDVRENQALESLHCAACGLTSLIMDNEKLDYLICGGNKLTTLDVSKSPVLMTLLCYDNKLTSLIVPKSLKLNTVNFYGNLIKGSDMDNLIESLPTRTGDGTFVVNGDWHSPDNIITPAQVTAAKGKGWNVVKRKGFPPSDTNYAGYGDINGDNKINETDRDTLVNIIMGQRPDNIGTYAGDLNNDQKTDAADVVIMVNILNGKQ